MADDVLKLRRILAERQHKESNTATLILQYKEYGKILMIFYQLKGDWGVRTRALKGNRQIHGSCASGKNRSQDVSNTLLTGHNLQGKSLRTKCRIVHSEKALNGSWMRNDWACVQPWPSLVEATRKMRNGLHKDLFPDWCALKILGDCVRAREAAKSSSQIS